MVKQFGPPPEADAAGYTRQILKGLAFLHELPVVHRDVKGENVRAVSYVLPAGPTVRTSCVCR